MTKDWVHGVGHSPVCQILLQIVVREVITSSPPAWISSAGTLSTPADFPFFSDCTAASTSLRKMGWYCSELYNYKANGGPSVLNCPQTDTEDDHPILRREVEAAVQSLKKGKSAGVDNVPAELVQAGGEDVITSLTTICNRIWQTGEWPTPWTQSLVITLPKKGNLQQCQNY